MEERNLKNWAEFKLVVDEIREKYGYVEFGDDKGYREKNTILFRGQSCSGWPLQTTLERSTSENLSVTQYLSKATRIVHELESFTGNKWNVPDYPSLVKEVKDRQNVLFGLHLPSYEYLVYLRHHGYPSPLLDWTESPYVAAYFAMCEVTKCGSEDDSRVAIFSYIDSIDNTKLAEGIGNPIIKVEGPYVSTHKRHFLQRAQYTMALKWSEKLDQHVFCSHHEVFDKPKHRQEILIKITIPVAERKKALLELYDYNINHFTLFQTEDSLLKTLSIRDFDIGI